MNKKIITISLIAVTLLALLAMFLGSGTGTDLGGKYSFVRISSKESFDIDAIKDIISREFRGLKDLSVQTTTENYNEQLVIKASEISKSDAEKMVESVKKQNPDAYLRSIDVVKSEHHNVSFGKIALVMLLMMGIIAVICFFRYGLMPALISVFNMAFSLGAYLAVASLMGNAMNADTVLGGGVVTLFLSALFYVLGAERAEIKKNTLAEYSEEEAVKVIRDGSFKMIVAISCMTVIFGLAGAIFAGRTNSASFLSISLSAVCSVAVTCLIGIRILVNRICRK